MRVEMGPAAVSGRLRELGGLCDLRADRRLATKLDMRPAAVSRRLRTLGSLTALCLRLGRRAVGDGRRRQAEARRRSPRQDGPSHLDARRDQPTSMAQPAADWLARTWDGGAALAPVRRALAIAPSEALRHE